MKRKLCFAVLSAAIVCLGNVQSMRADNPNHVVRTFGILLGSGVDIEDVPDFFCEESIMVMVDEADENNSGIEHTFIDDWPGQPEFLDGSTWIAGKTLRHVTKGGAPQTVGFVLWLDDGVTPDPHLPPKRSHAFTGSDVNNSIVHAQLVEVAICVNSSCNFDSSLDGLLHTVDGGEAGELFLIVTAEFSK